jgi:hypothetical protein
MKVTKRKDVYLLGGIPNGQEVRCFGYICIDRVETWIALSSSNGLKYAYHLEVGERMKMKSIAIVSVLDRDGGIDIRTTEGTLRLEEERKAFWNGQEVTVYESRW